MDSLFNKETFFSMLKSNQSSCGTVTLRLPKIDGSGGTGSVIRGFLEEDFELKMGNKWGSVIPDFKAAKEIGQILNVQNVLTWIASSAAAWESSQPIEFSLNIYLITLTRNQSPSIIDEAKEIMKLMALYTDESNFATAKVHGGYSVDYATFNNELGNLFGSKPDDLFAKANDSKDKVISDINALGKKYTSTGNGTIAVDINDELHFKNLLLSDGSFTHSSAYVDAITPLYIKMNLSFRTCRAPIVKDIEEMYRG